MPITTPVERLTRSGAELPQGLLAAVIALEQRTDVHMSLDWSLDQLCDATARRSATAERGWTVLADRALTRAVLRKAVVRCGVERQEEFVFPSTNGAALAAVQRIGSPPVHADDCNPRLESRVADRLRAGAETLSAVGDWMRETGDVNRARHSWRVLLQSPALILGEPSFHALDSLLHCLEWSGLIILDQFRECLNDLILRNQRRRPEFMSDIRAIIRGALSPPQFDPGRWMRRLLVQRCLHFAADPGDEDRLRRWVGLATQRATVLPRLDACFHRPPSGSMPPDRGMSDHAAPQVWRMARAARCRDEPGHDYAAVDRQIAAHRKLWQSTITGCDLHLELGAPEVPTIRWILADDGELVSAC